MIIGEGFYVYDATHRLVYPIRHFPDDGLQLDHGHVGGLVVGVRGVVAPQEACRKTARAYK